MGRRFFYTTEQIEFLRNHRPLMTDCELTERFNETFNLKKPYNTIRRLCVVYGAKTRPQRFYTTEQIGFLRKHRPLMTDCELTERFNETFGRSASAANIASLCEYHSIKTGRYLPPAPIGAEAVHDGYVKVKTDKRRQDGHFEWRGKHILLCESVYGPVAKGYRILFSDGDNRNFSLDNLVMVTIREHSYLNANKLRFSDAEFTKVAVSIAKLGVAIKDKKNALRENASTSAQ